MPIYEYKCAGCQSHFEKLQKVSDQPLQVCELCGGRLEKQVSLSGFQLKGAGWYVTDYVKKSGAAGTETSEKSEKSDKSDKNEKSEKSETTEKNSAAESTAKTETASNTSNDAKPAAKTETVSKKE